MFLFVGRDVGQSCSIFLERGLDEDEDLNSPIDQQNSCSIARVHPGGEWQMPSDTNF